MDKYTSVFFAVVLGCSAFGVDIQLVRDDAARTVTVNYANNGSTATTRARAFALTVTVTGGATITGVSEFPDGTYESTYRVYPGSISINEETGEVVSYGSPVEPNNLHGSGQSSINSKQVILAMCSLYTGTNAPAATGKLCKIWLSALTDYVTVTVTPEVTYRGGIIAEDGNSLIVASQSTSFGHEHCGCYGCNSPAYDVWVSWGMPMCWCFRRQCRGDLNNMAFLGKWVSSVDLTVFKVCYNKSDDDLKKLVVNGIPCICADLNHSPFLGRRVTSSDLTEFKKYYNQANVPVCDSFDYNFWY